MRRSRTQRAVDTTLVQLDLFAPVEGGALVEAVAIVDAPNAIESVNATKEADETEDARVPDIAPGDLAVFRSPHFDFGDPFPDDDPRGSNTPFFVTRWSGGYLYGVRADRVAPGTTLADVLAAVTAGALYERSLAYHPGPPEYRLLNRENPSRTYFSPYHDLTIAREDVGRYLRLSRVEVSAALASVFAEALARRPDLLAVVFRGTRWQTAHDRIRVDLLLYARGTEMAVLPVGVAERSGSGWGGAMGSCVSKAMRTKAMKAFVELAQEEASLWSK